MSLYHTEQSDQSEIYMINGGLSEQRDGTARVKKKERKKEGTTDLKREKMNGNILYRVTGQRTEQIAGNDEKQQMKTSWKLCEYGIKSGQRGEI